MVQKEKGVCITVYYNIRLVLSTTAILVFVRIFPDLFPRRFCRQLLGGGGDGGAGVALIVG